MFWYTIYLNNVWYTIYIEVIKLSEQRNMNDGMDRCVVKGCNTRLQKAPDGAWACPRCDTHLWKHDWAENGFLMPGICKICGIKSSTRCFDCGLCQECHK